MVLNSHIPFVENVKNLGVILDSQLSFDAHIKHICRGLYLQLRRLGQIRNYLSFDSAKKVAVVFIILSRLDYFNALLLGLPDEQVNKLQRIQNSAAILVMRKSKHDSVRLYGLPVKARIEYKVALLCHQCLYNNEMSSYLKGIIKPYVPQRTADYLLLEVPRFSRTTVGLKTFSYPVRRCGINFLQNSE